LPRAAAERKDAARHPSSRVAARKRSCDNFALNPPPLIDLFLQDESRWKFPKWLSLRLSR